MFKSLRLIAFATLACLSIAACDFGGVASTPAAMAGATTTLDERAAIGVETAYTAAAKGAALAIRARLVTDPATIRRIGELDNRAYLAVTATRSAYLAGNAASYGAAFTEANAALRSLLAAF